MPLFWESTDNSHILAVQATALKSAGNPVSRFVRKRLCAMEKRGMKKRDLQERVRDSHRRLIGALDGLTEEQATRVGLNPQWSVKDLLSHIVAWEQEGARIISEIQQGTWKQQRLNRQAIDDFNARAVKDRRERSIREVREEFDRAHARIEHLIASLPDEVEESSPAYKWVEGVTFKHHAHHAAQIEEYKQRVKPER